MDFDIDQIDKIASAEMEKSIEHFSTELTKIRAGRANPIMLNGVMVDYYGTDTPLNQVANVSAVDSRTLSIQPWEKTMLAPIEKAIFEANLGVTPQNDGEFVRIMIPPLTEERRLSLVKQTKAIGEDTKIAIRSVRQKMMDAIKKEVKDGYPEDAGKRKEGIIEDLVKANYSKVEKILQAKEEDILKV